MRMVKKCLRFICNNMLLLLILLFSLAISTTKLVDIKIQEPLLYGVVDEYETYDKNIRNISTGKYQEYLENNYLNTFTFRNYFVRFYNELLFKIKASRNDLVHGKEGWLFGGSDINMYVNALEVSQSIDQYEAYARNIQKIQSYLVENGKKFIYVISPSKAEIYEDKLSPNIKASKVELNNHVRLREALEKYHVTYVDATEISLQLKEQGYNPFYINSFHWSELTAVITLNKAFEMIAEGDSEKLVLKYDCQMVEEPLGADADLYELSNILSEPPTERYYKISVRDTVNVYEPQKEICFIGTSFCQQFTDLFFSSRMFDDIIHYRYLQFGYKTHDDGNWYFDVEENVEDNNLEKILSENDIIVYETNAMGVLDSHIKIAEYLAQYIDNLTINQVDNKIDDTTIVDFLLEGNSDSFCPWGLHGQEDAGRWSKDEFKIVINSSSQKDINVEIDAELFLPEYTVSVFANGFRIRDNIVGNDGKLRSFVIGKDYIRKGKNAIVFKVGGITSPKEENLGEDSRELGMFLRNIVFAQ